MPANQSSLCLSKESAYKINIIKEVLSVSESATC